MTMALVDGDIFTRRYTAAAEYEMYTIQKDGRCIDMRGKRNTEKYIKENPEWKIIDSYKQVDPIQWVKHSINLALIDIQDACKVGDFAIFLGEKGGKNFRHDLYPEYKSSRAGKPKPIHYEPIYNWLVEQHDAVVVYNIEADDALGIRSDTYANSIICSNDKDLLQIPGEHYNFVDKERIHVSQFDGDYRLFRQILMGDSTDDIPGLPNIGKGKSKKLLEGVTTVEGMSLVAREAYKKEYKDEWKEKFMETGQLVYILRKTGDSFGQYLVRKGLVEEVMVT